MHLLAARNVKVMELDFKADKWSPALLESIKDVDVVFAADGGLLLKFLSIDLLKIFKFFLLNQFLSLEQIF